MNGDSSSATDVLVVGAGPTGLTLAGELARRGASCRIIDRAPAPADTSRALGIHSRTLELFAEMGIVERALSQGVRVTGTTVLQGDLPVAHFSVFKHLPAPYPFVLLLPQTVTESLLAALLMERSVEVERGWELTAVRQDGDAAIATISDHRGEKQEVRARWVVGCDGMASRVRALMDMPFEAHAAPEVYAIVDADLDWDRSRQDTYVWVHEEGLLAAMPLPGDRRWRLFASFRRPVRESPPDKSHELFEGILAERAADRTTRIRDVVWSSEYAIQRRVARQYRRGNLFLAGDAAHVQSPVGGQGMNTGIQDAYNLAWKLALVAQDRAVPALLDTYEAERLPVAQAALEDEGESAKFLLSRSPGLRFVDPATLAHLARLEFVQAAIAREASELYSNYRRSALSVNYTGNGADRLGAAGPQAGDRAPDGACRRYPDRVPSSLFGEWRDSPFRLLLFAGESAQSADGRARLARLADAADTRLGALNQAFLIAGVAPEAPPAGVPVLVDTDGELRGAYHAPGEAVFLVRPDGYVAYRGKPADEAPFLQYLDTIGIK